MRRRRLTGYQMRHLDEYLLSDTEEVKAFRQRTVELISGLDVTPSQVAKRILKQSSSFFGRRNSQSVRRFSHQACSSGSRARAQPSTRNPPLTVTCAAQQSACNPSQEVASERVRDVDRIYSCLGDLIDRLQSMSQIHTHGSLGVNIKSILLFTQNIVKQLNQSIDQIVGFEETVQSITESVDRIQNEMRGA